MTASTVGRTLDASELFNLKWPATARQVDFRAHHHHLRPDQADDLAQGAALYLWQFCMKAAAGKRVRFEVATEYAVLTALTAIMRANRRHRAQPIEEAIDAPAPAAQLRQGGCTFTMADVRIDHPEAVATASDGYTLQQAAGRLGVSRERIRQIGPKLGQIRLGGRYRLSRQLVDARANARQTARSGRCGVRTA